MTAATAYWFLPAVIPLAMYISWNDMRSMKITNQSMLVLLIVFIVLGPFAFGLRTYFWQFLHFPFVLIIGMALWSLRLMGGGDAKMLAVMAPYVVVSDLYSIAQLFVACALAGLTMHGIFRYTSLHKLAPDWKSWEARSEHLRGGIFGLNHAFPKGLVLSMTLLFYLIAVAVYR
ncbi:prepilin peptidase [Yoonia sp. BS5-3]|uniref:Prepilin peptidase n=1 Tax=Yoonia phaeophyticola TaxID=3137369 RepID=A0ABZ2V4D8_9RHOB